MEHESSGTRVAQLTMAGMPPRGRTQAATLYYPSPGQMVQYLGEVAGGPRHGTKGLVKEALAHRAAVDMGRSGTWRIPYLFLATLRRAA